MDDPRLTALHLIERNECYPQELWVRYWANGGQAQQLEFDAYLHGMYQLSAFDLKILAWALEEITP
ncbi:hypothetical protein AAIH32_16165 [Pseudarthrobacter oxydans]|uniref:hypothetical protein n=1 Tax=Pseudarthrobacter oxydans TaxID=1671 RepID=UPI003D2A3DB4